MPFGKLEIASLSPVLTCLSVLFSFVVFERAYLCAVGRACWFLLPACYIVSVLRNRGL